MSADFERLTPWMPIEPQESDRFEDEYALEISKHHPLYGVPAKAIARRVDKDDVLFRLLRYLCDYAVVHLTWSGREEADPAWPSCNIYADTDHFMEECMRPSHEGTNHDHYGSQLEQHVTPGSRLGHAWKCKIHR